MGNDHNEIFIGHINDEITLINRYNRKENKSVILITCGAHKRAATSILDSIHLPGKI